MHSSCMRGELAGTESCCRKVEAQPLAALHAANAEYGAPALMPLTAAMPAVVAVPPCGCMPEANVSPTPPVSLYALHASLQI